MGHSLSLIRIDGGGDVEGKMSKANVEHVVSGEYPDVELQFYWEAEEQIKLFWHVLVALLFCCFGGHLTLGCSRLVL